MTLQLGESGKRPWELNSGIVPVALMRLQTRNLPRQNVKELFWLSSQNLLVECIQGYDDGSLLKLV